jgi:two-component SAPR family response regulator
MAVLNPRPVLFLDDERSYVELMAELLSENLNCLILPFTRPDEALMALPSTHVGMIVTDYYMPLMNGIEFLHRAREACPTITAIMITGHQIELGGQDMTVVPGLRKVLFKPVRWRLLAETIIQHWPDGNPPALKMSV